ncbi:MAG: Ig-like domain-containing protein, partial [Pseudonocardiaceae bacterium]
PVPPSTGSTATTTELFAFPAKTHPDSFVLLIAKVAPANATGTVQFNDGTAALGDPVHVFNGFALFFIGKLTSGAHSLTAVFTPTDPAASPSTSNTISYGENVAHGVKATKTRLTVIPSGPFAQAVPRLLIANVTPTGAAGTVQFSDGSSVLGAPLQVFNGVAFLSTSALASGTHSLTAAFTPTDPAAFGPSTSAVVPLPAGARSQPPISGRPATGSVFQPLQLLQSLFSGLGL